MKTLLFTCLVIFFSSCKKESIKQCPLQTYKIQCDTKSLNFEFGVYNTGTETFFIEANCPDDANKAAKDMSYDLGQLYKHCRVIP